MKMIPLKNRILNSFILVILVLATSIALLGFYIIKKDIIERAQVQVENNLKVARSVYRAELDRIGQTLRIISLSRDIENLQMETGLHYIGVAYPDQLQDTQSEIVKAAAQRGEPVGGTRIIGPGELKTLPDSLQQRAAIPILFTQRARPTDQKILSSAMAKEYAIPIRSSGGDIERILYGGKVINRDYSFVDRIRSLVFGNEIYKEKPVGTVTIFQDDVRVATNVVDEQGSRAIGTRVSEEVYEKVVEGGKIWHDRAFVVTDWYKTAYEPIRDINQNVIGILYVGILEAPFTHLSRNIMILFITIVIAAVVLAVVFAFILASNISRPITEMRDATEKLATGTFDQDYEPKTDIRELNDLAKSFNHMAHRLHQREKSLKISNEKLVQSNKNYIDLIRFVAHELNGILGSAIMNTYSVRDGFLGMINFKQRKAIDSVARNLDYLAATVKKFLSLGRIERGELPVNKAHINLKKDVFDISLDSLSPVAARKEIQVTNRIDPALELDADPDLLKVVANNLISNAIKYGNPRGRVDVSCESQNGKIQVEVYNDGEPISAEQKDKLFRRFSRLDNPTTRREKGNGLGLYITRNIIASHGGKIWVEPRENGNSFIFNLEREENRVNANGNY